MNAAGTGRMLGLVLRRERLHATAWFGGVGLLIAAVTAGIVATYPTESARAELAASVQHSVGELFLIGRLRGSGVGELALWRVQGIAVIFVSVAAILTVLRNTRGMEDDGTLELLGGARIGRAAPLLATLGVTSTGCLLSGLFTGTGFLLIDSGPAAAAASGARVLLVGLLATAIAAVAGEIFRNARAAVSAAMVAIAVLYLARGAGDALGGSSYWLSPFGWIFSTPDRGAAAAAAPLIALLLCLGLGAVALRLASERDLGAGLLPERSGPAKAPRWMTGVIGLTLRLALSTLITTTAAALAIGAVIGAVSRTVDQQIPLSAGGVTGGRGLAPVAIYLSAMFAAAAGILQVLRTRAEVRAGRADLILSRPVTHRRWITAHLITGGLSALLLTTALSAGIGLGESRQAGAFLLAGLLRATAAWIFIALAAVLVVASPGLASALSFTVLGAYLALELCTEFQLVPEAALAASPFALAPQLPDGPFNALSTTLLIALTAALAALALRLARTSQVE